MRIDTRPATQAPGPVASSRRAAGTGPGFRLEDAPGAGAAARPAVATGLAGLDAVLILQGGSETPHERRRRQTRRGHDLLDGLDRLKAALLGGRVAVHELRAIAGRLAERSPASGDPHLDGLLADIELRAAVELAKLEARPGA